MGDRRLTPAQRMATVPVARLATVDDTGAPHVVPITFACDGDTIVTAIDHKPKRTTRLKRLANIAAEPRVAVLADRYEDDWTRLWWVRADGIAAIVEPDDPLHARAIDRLSDRYVQYRTTSITGPAIVISVTAWSQWLSSPDRP